MKRINIRIASSIAKDMEALRGITGKTNEQIISDAWDCYARGGNRLDDELQQLIAVFLKHRVQAREDHDGDEVS